MDRMRQVLLWLVTAIACAPFIIARLPSQLSNAYGCQGCTSAPHVYQPVQDFPQLPSDLVLGQVSAVATDSKGNVYVFHRGPRPILVFNQTGKLLRSLGDGLFKSPHGLRIDRHDNIWVTDNANHTVMKLSPEGKVLMKLGETDVAGEDHSHFNRPTDIAFASNGEVYVADGYGNSRVVKFDRNGKFLKTWGKKGTSQGEFNLPHAICVDSKGQVYVGDRENNRIQIFDSEGKFLSQLPGMAPFGLFLAAEDTIFVADGRAHRIMKLSSEGRLLTEWGTKGIAPGQFDLPHGIAVGADGAVYVAEINGKRVQKFVRSGSVVLPANAAN